MTTYRTATLAELIVILDWAAAEGWNPGHDDAAAFFAADPEGFFVAERDGVLIGAISVVNHTADFAFLGLYIVQPAYRGQGIGLALWSHALAHAGARVVGLDGVPDQQDNYAASGFGHSGATTRFSGDIAGALDPDMTVATTADIPALIETEAQASGVRKPAYLSAWLAETATRRTLLLGHVGAFATLRVCRSGAKIGPLCAPDANAARRLMQHAAATSPGPIVIVPDAAQDLAQVCRDFGMMPGFETARMYRGEFSAQCPPVFAVTSLELG